jgi:bis(5'-nucleosidyl)-tetraphosphatase
VIYFLAETASLDVTLSHEHCGYQWLSYDETLGRLTFKNARDLLTKAEGLLQTEAASAG